MQEPGFRATDLTLSLANPATFHTGSAPSNERHRSLSRYSAYAGRHAGSLPAWLVRNPQSGPHSYGSFMHMR